MNDTDGEEYQGYVPRVIAGASVGAIIGLFSGVIFLAVGANNVDVESLSAVVPWRVCMTTTITAGIIAGATGATINRVGRPSIKPLFVNVASSILGGGIGGAIGGTIGVVAMCLVSNDWTLVGYLVVCGAVSSLLAGSVIGFISGSATAMVGTPWCMPASLALTGLLCGVWNCSNTRDPSTGLWLGALSGSMSISLIWIIGKAFGSARSALISEVVRTGAFGAAIGGAFGAIAGVTFAIANWLL